MSTVCCPTCGEKGNLADQLLGRKIRCQKCGTTFVAGGGAAPTSNGGPGPLPAANVNAAPGPAAQTQPASGTIEVDGLDPSTWTLAALDVPVEQARPTKTQSELAPGPAHEHAADGPGPMPGEARQYKVLTSKDRWFEGKYEFTKLEACLNHYARQGWIVKGMATPHVTGFSGGPREELMIILER